MGEWTRAEFAYMVPTHDGKVPEDRPGDSVHRIFKVRTDDVPAFKRANDKYGTVYHPIYGLHDWTDSIVTARHREVDKPAGGVVDS